MGSGEGEGYTLNLPVPAGSEGELWCSLLEHVVLPAAAAFEPQLVLVSAGFDAHVGDPLAGCRLQTELVRGDGLPRARAAARLGAPLGAVLEGGYEPRSVAECVQATLTALAGEGEAVSSAPEALLTSRAAAQIGHYWPL